MDHSNLHQASYDGDISAVEKLLQNGANIQKGNKKNDTPLHLAALRDHVPILKLLLEKGANKDSKNNMGETPLHCAASAGNSAAIRELINAGADLFATNNNKETALHRAAVKGDDSVVKTLLEFDDDVIAKNEWGNTPLHLAAACGKVKVVEVLLSFQDCSSGMLEATNNILQTPLHRAAFGGYLDIVRLLLKAGANKDAKKNDGLTPLHLATIQGHLSVMKELTEGGANVYNINKSGNTGAHHAAFNGRCEIVKLLLENQFDVNYKNSKRNTLLHLAAREGHTAAVRLLLKHGAHVDVYNKANTTPLSLAARLGHTDVVIELMKAGIDTVKLEEGPSILHAAAIGNRLHTIQAIVTQISDENWLQRKWNGFTADEHANIYGNVHIVWWLRKQLSGTSRGETSLQSQWISCKERYERSGLDIIQRAKTKSKEQTDWLVKGITDGEIEMHFMDEVGNTILHAAKSSDNELAVKKLIEVGALPTARNHKGETPLDFTTPLPLDSRISSYLYTVLLNIISRSVSLDTPSDKNEEGQASENDDVDIDDERNMKSNADKVVQEKKLKVLRLVSKILTLGIPLDPPGSCDRHLLPLAITTNNKTLLPILLASGVPLTTVNSGLGIIQLACLTPDVTIWVGMVVTRAVVHRLHVEKDLMEEKSSDPVVAVLSTCICKLIEDLHGDKPCEAVFKKPENGTLTELFVTVCKLGATMTAWYIWNAGGSHYKRAFKSTPLEAAVAEKKFTTADRLVLDMKANPFMKDLENSILIEKFPHDSQLLEMMFGQDFRRLDRIMEKAKDKCDKTEFQQIIILFMILYLQYKSKDTVQKWRSYFSLIMKGYSQMKNDTDNWMCTLAEFLESDGVNGLKFVPDELEISEEIRKIHMHIGLLETEEKEYCLPNTTDQFYNLFYILESNFNIQTTENAEDAGHSILFEKALRISCEQHLPLLLHLLISIGKQDVNAILNEVCQTRPLHHAAKNGNISAIAYLLDNGASLTFKDRGGILPVHYAFMYGHRSAGKYLIKNMKNGEITKDTSFEESSLPKDYLQRLCTSHNGLACRDDEMGFIENSAVSFGKANELYLKNYHLNPEMNEKSRYIQVRNNMQLLADRLGVLRKEWENKGINASVEDIAVNYQDEEAQEVKNAVTKFLSLLKDEIASVNKFYEGDLELVGSSADNVRLHCPDEYDCNLLLKNVSALKDGGLKCDLLEYESDKEQFFGHKQYLKIEAVKKELEDLFSGSNFLDEFYNIAKESLIKMDLSCHHLKMLLPGIKRTQVGVAVSLLWLGNKYPILFVDVDIVPTVRAPWPSKLLKPECIAHANLKEVFVNSVGENEWRFSFGSAETLVMKALSDNQRAAYLACKMVLSVLKTENWVPWNIKCNYMYWDSQLFSLSSKGGFALKNSFLRELEEVKDAQEWESQNLLKRMCSVFERMCEMEGALSKAEKKKSKIVTAKAIRAYFGGNAEKASVYLIAPEILAFLKSLDNSIIAK